MNNEEYELPLLDNERVLDDDVESLEFGDVTLEEDTLFDRSNHVTRKYHRGRRFRMSRKAFACLFVVLLAITGIFVVLVVWPSTKSLSVDIAQHNKTNSSQLEGSTTTKFHEHSSSVSPSTRIHTTTTQAVVGTTSSVLLKTISSTVIEATSTRAPTTKLETTSSETTIKISTSKPMETTKPITTAIRTTSAPMKTTKSSFTTKGDLYTTVAATTAEIEKDETTPFIWYGEEASTALDYDDIVTTPINVKATSKPVLTTQKISQTTQIVEESTQRIAETTHQTTPRLKLQTTQKMQETTQKKEQTTQNRLEQTSQDEHLKEDSQQYFDYSYDQMTSKEEQFVDENDHNIPQDALPSKRPDPGEDLFHGSTSAYLPSDALERPYNQADLKDSEGIVQESLNRSTAPRNSSRLTNQGEQRNRESEHLFDDASQHMTSTVDQFADKNVNIPDDLQPSEGQDPEEDVFQGSASAFPPMDVIGDKAEQQDDSVARSDTRENLADDKSGIIQESIINPTTLRNVSGKTSQDDQSIEGFKQLLGDAYQPKTDDQFVDEKPKDSQPNERKDLEEESFQGNIYDYRPNEGEQNAKDESKIGLDAQDDVHQNTGRIEEEPSLDYPTPSQNAPGIVKSEQPIFPDPTTTTTFIPKDTKSDSDYSGYRYDYDNTDSSYQPNEDDENAKDESKIRPDPQEDDQQDSGRFKQGPSLDYPTLSQNAPGIVKSEQPIFPVPTSTTTFEYDYNNADSSYNAPPPDPDGYEELEY